MTRDVLISIQGLQLVSSEVREAVATDEELDSIKTICSGEYYCRDGTQFVLYEELTEDYGEPVKNMIKFKDNEFTLTKKGAVNAQMVFWEGKKTMTEYFTPFGSLLIALDTKKIDVEEGDDFLNIHIGYGLEANYQFIADCDIKVEIKNRVGN